MQITDKRLRELEDVVDDIAPCIDADEPLELEWLSQDLKGAAPTVDELRALIAAYRERHGISSPAVQAFIDRVKDLPEDELGERLANLGF